MRRLAADPTPSSAIASTTSPFRRASSTRIDWPPCSSAFWSSSLKTSASAVARLPASETGSMADSTLLPRREPLHEHRAQPVEQLAEVDVLVASLRQHLVHGRDRQDPVDRVVERTPRVDADGL